MKKALTTLACVVAGALLVCLLRPAAPTPPAAAGTNAPPVIVQSTTVHVTVPAAPAPPAAARAAPPAPAHAPSAPGSPEEAAPPTAPEARSIDIALTYPKPLFIGTPKSVVLARGVHDPMAGRRDGFRAPAGTRLLSRGKPVASSDPNPVIGELGYVTDGDKEGGDGSYVELGPGCQYVQIDLEAEAWIYAIAVWHYHSQARAYHDVVVQLADTPDFTAPVTVFSNDHDNSLGLGPATDDEYIETNKGLLIETGGKRGRYVRLYSNGSTASEMNHYIEVEVYGVPAEGQP